MNKCQNYVFRVLSHDYLLAFLWAGMILGLSFIATPAKFAAPNLERIVALEVGQVTFKLFNKVEWVMALLLAMTMLRKKYRGLKWLIRFIIVLLALQTFYLLPELRNQFSLIEKGGAGLQGFHHSMYVAVEVLKLMALIALGTRQVKNQRENSVVPLE
jgi:hypothetical protein